jgi:hypothetical protein
LFHYYGDYSTSTFLPSVCFLLKEGEGGRRGERVRINRLTFYVFKGRREREREGYRERIDLPFVFFKEGRREREKKEEEEEEEERR